MYKYAHGGGAAFEQGGESVTDLSANINPLGIPAGVESAIVSSIQHISRYPDNYSSILREKIAKWENINSSYIFCGNGASDIIFRLPACVKANSAMVLAPTFSDYERALKSAGATVIHHVLHEQNGFKPTISLISDMINAKPDILFICSPNNPTGIVTDINITEKVLQTAAITQTTVVIDECFIDFAENGQQFSAKPYLDKYDNLVIIKAFTKIFALPGIRLGYCMCTNSGVIQSLYENGADWAVSNLAQAAGEAAIQTAIESDYISRTQSFVSEQRTYLQHSLTELGLSVFEGSANYVLFKEPTGLNLNALLHKYKIRIRNCGNYIGLTGGHWRVAVSTKESNKLFINAMACVLKYT